MFAVEADAAINAQKRIVNTVIALVNTVLN